MTKARSLTSKLQTLAWQSELRTTTAPPKKAVGRAFLARSDTWHPRAFSKIRVMIRGLTPTASEWSFSTSWPERNSLPVTRMTWSRKRFAKDQSWDKECGRTIRMNWEDLSKTCLPKIRANEWTFRRLNDTSGWLELWLGPSIKTEPTGELLRPYREQSRLK